LQVEASDIEKSMIGLIGRSVGICAIIVLITAFLLRVKLNSRMQAPGDVDMRQPEGRARMALISRKKRPPIAAKVAAE